MNQIGGNSSAFTLGVAESGGFIVFAAAIKVRDLRRVRHYVPTDGRVVWSAVSQRRLGIWHFLFGLAAALATCGIVLLVR